MNLTAAKSTGLSKSIGTLLVKVMTMPSIVASTTMGKPKYTSLVASVTRTPVASAAREQASVEG